MKKQKIFFTQLKWIKGLLALFLFYAKYKVLYFFRKIEDCRFLLQKKSGTITAIKSINNLK